MKKYKVEKDCLINSVVYKKGDNVMLSDAQAQHYLFKSKIKIYTKQKNGDKK